MPFQSVSCFVFVNTIFEEKKHTLIPKITILYQFHDQKVLFKVPKICNMNFWIASEPPLGTFPKIHPIWWRDPSLTSQSAYAFNQPGPFQFLCPFKI